jgi:hypothetical protein
MIDLTSTAAQIDLDHARMLLRIMVGDGPMRLETEYAGSLLTSLVRVAGNGDLAVGIEALLAGSGQDPELVESALGLWASWHRRWGWSAELETDSPRH